MRIALISDIHGNNVALDAVLANLQPEPLDLLVCLGDVAATGPQPRAVLEQLRALACPVVMGNTDAWLLNPEPWPAEDENRRMVLEVELWGARQLTEEDRTFIRTFRPTVAVALEGGKSLLCYHGSPQNFNDVIRATTLEEDLEGYLSGTDAEVVAGGHTHEPMVRTFAGKWVVNPGSVGLPLVRVGGEIQNPLWAEYALLEAIDKELRVELRRVPVDFEDLQEAVYESGMPHGEQWLADWQ